MVVAVDSCTTITTRRPLQRRPPTGTSPPRSTTTFPFPGRSIRRHLRHRRVLPLIVSPPLHHRPSDRSHRRCPRWPHIPVQLLLEQLPLRSPRDGAAAGTRTVGRSWICCPAPTAATATHWTLADCTLVRWWRYLATTARTTTMWAGSRELRRVEVATITTTTTTSRSTALVLVVLQVAQASPQRHWPPHSTTALCIEVPLPPVCTIMACRRAPLPPPPPRHRPPLQRADTTSTTIHRFQLLLQVLSPPRSLQFTITATTAPLRRPARIIVSSCCTTPPIRSCSTPARSVWPRGHRPVPPALPLPLSPSTAAVEVDLTATVVVVADQLQLACINISTSNISKSTSHWRFH